MLQPLGPAAGLIFNREKRNPAKLLGILLSFAAIAVLSAGPQSSTASTTERKLAMSLVVALVISPVVVWGLSDYFASQVARHLDMFSVRVAVESGGVGDAGGDVRGRGKGVLAQPLTRCVYCRLVGVVVWAPCR